MKIDLIALVTSGTTLVGVLIVWIKFWTFLQSKAKVEGKKEEQFEVMIKDVNGYGLRLTEVEIKNYETKNKISKIETEISSKLDIILFKVEGTEKRMDRIETAIFDKK